MTHRERNNLIALIIVAGLIISPIIYGNLRNSGNMPSPVLAIAGVVLLTLIFVTYFYIRFIKARNKD